MQNPFIINIEQTKSEFSEIQEEEIHKITNLLRNKTSCLIKFNGISELRYLLSQLKINYNILRFDFIQCNQLINVVNMIVTKIYQYLDDHEKPKFTESLRFFNPNVNQQERNISFQYYDETQSNYIIEEVFKFIKNYEIIIVFDGLDKIIKKLPETAEMLIKLFEKYNCNPFILTFYSSIITPRYFKSIEKINPKKAIQENYFKLIFDSFKSHRKIITDEAITEILYWTKSQINYTRKLCEKIFNYSDKKIDVNLVKKVELQLIDDYSWEYEAIINLLTKNQLNLLIAISKENSVKRPMSKDFIFRYRLSSVSTVKQSLDFLISKELVSFNGKTYEPNNIFLAYYLSTY